ncbi:MAG: DNA-directed RNA polymerase subunit E [Methanobacteriota archaeon]|nr:MAG: DNA-directed RNA polymerase subunit E [Euryarchaeota archaeon]
MKLNACKECKKLTELDICPVCKGRTTPHWVGFVAVADPERSEIAKKMGIATKGKFALKVR